MSHIDSLHTLFQTNYDNVHFFKEKGKNKVFNIKQQRDNDEEKGNSSEVTTAGHSSTEICQ